MGIRPHILMCPPDYYGIEYEINPWMDRRVPSDWYLARQQWHTLRDLLEKAGVRVSYVPPVKGLPDLVFTANAAMIFRDRAVPSRFRPLQRQPEEPVYQNWLRNAGFQLSELPAGVYFEGAGDALFCGDTLFAGYRTRSDARGHQILGEMIGCRVIPLELVANRFYHLDTCFCPLAPGVALYYPAAFDDYGRRVLESLVDDLIAVGEDEAGQFACNAVVVGNVVITNTGCQRLRDDLERRGFELWETPLSEFVKAGGSAKCLTLRLDGEQAAAWRDPQLQLAAPGNRPAR